MKGVIMPQYKKSPLRYPGGKSRAVEKILSLLPEDLETLYSPFMGGGSVEIACAEGGINVHAYDISAPLVNFWQYALSNANEMAEYIKFNLYPLPKGYFNFLQKETNNVGFINACTFYVLNRASFSGITYNCGMSKGHPRYNENSINYLRNFKCNNLSVEQRDFVTSIEWAGNNFLYCDPPYYGVKNLYPDSFTEQDHIKLYDLLKIRQSWILSYNDVPAIRTLYNNYEIVSPSWKYGMGSSKVSNEILILNI